LPDRASTVPEAAAPETLSAWTEVLDRLEHDLSIAEVPGSLTDSWVPPRGIGPLPRELAARARTILVAQTAALGRMQEEQGMIVKHTAALESIPTRRRAYRPVYLDHSA
jgi:hypothetical protein